VRVWVSELGIYGRGEARRGDDVPMDLPRMTSPKMTCLSSR
jgi:hypothetical protein